MAGADFEGLVQRYANGSLQLGLHTLPAQLVVWYDHHLAMPGQQLVPELS